MRETRRTRTLVILVAIVGLVAAACSSAPGAGGDQKFTVGVSNTLVGNGWREEMICAVKAQSLASGKVDKVIVANRNGGAQEQIADLESLISQGVDAIIVNPSDRTALDPVIKAAKEKNIVVVAVDQAVDAPEAYVVTNDQVAYGRLGAEWLFEQLGGEGNVVEMRGIEGVPADTDRHQGFEEALAKYPNINVVQETFTGWDFAKGSQQALDIISNEDVDGVWTSGIDYVVVEAFATANKEPAPVVGADNNGFIKNLLDGAPGAAVTNPAVIGGVGTSIALDVLGGKTVNRETILTPDVWDLESDKATLEANYFADRDPTFSAAVKVDPYTTYTPEQLFACKGPGE
jgi:ribose transport system substrate-binding protein